VKSRKRADAEEALTALRFAALTSPDLIPDDAERLAARGKEIMTRCYTGVMQNLQLKTSTDVPDVLGAGLYDKAAGAEPGR
jgi:hypothetical protein